MATTETHATRSDDWRVYGHNLAAEAEHMGGQFTDARRLMLDTWQAWTSGEPDPTEIIYELLATLWAMSMSSGIEGLEEPLEAIATALEAKL